MDFQKIRYGKREGIATITFDVPEKHNPFQFPREPGSMTAEIVAAMDDAADDDDVKVLVFKGAGPSFSSGADLTHVGFVYGMGTGQQGERRPSQRIRLKKDSELMSFFKQVFLHPKVTIAQVHGHCIGLAFLLVSFCDLCVAADDARFSRSDQRLGFAGNAGDFNVLAFNIGLKRTMKLLLTGETLSGTEAEEIGLINDAVPLADLEGKTQQLARQVASMPRDGIAIAKAMRSLHYDSLGITRGIDLHVVGHTMHTNLRWEADEYNYFRERRDKGAKAAFKERDALFERGERDALFERGERDALFERENPT